MNTGMVGRTRSTRTFGILAASLSLSAVSLAQAPSSHPGGIDRLFQKGAATLQQLPSLFADSVTASLEKDFTTSSIAPVAILDPSRRAENVSADLAPVENANLADASNSDSIFVGSAPKPFFRKSTSKGKASSSVLDTAIASEIGSTVAATGGVSLTARDLVGSAAPVPEPGTFVALGLGALGILRRHKK